MTGSTEKPQNSQEDASISIDEHFAMFVSNAPVSVAMFDRKMRYVAWSREWADTYGLGDRDLSGRCHYDIFPDLSENWRKAHQRGLNGEFLFSEEDRFVHADGRVSWERWRIKPIPSDEGKTAGIVMFTEDITDQKEAEAALEKNEERLRLLIESFGIGLFEKNYITDGGQVSDTFLSLLGLSADALPETLEEWLEALNPPDPELFLELRARAMDPDGDGQISCEINPVVDGRKRFMRVRARVMFDRSVSPARPVELLGILIDETEQRALLEALARAQRLETVGRLAGMIAHDFNNLLTVVLANLELAALHTRDDTVADLLQKGIDAAAMGGDFNKRLLALAGGNEFRAEVFPVDAHISRAWEVFDRLLADDIDLRFVPGAGEENISIDPAELDGALLNLIVNARDAQPDGGEIVVSTRQASLSEAEAAQYPGGRPGNFIRISVRDFGIGMSPETVIRAQEPFFSTKGPSKGTGLGLTSVAATAARAGGFVAISSTEGAGAEVCLFLPVAEGPGADLAAGDGDFPFGNGELVLVVEDDPLVRETAMQRLEAVGYAVLEAGDGESALKLLSEGEPVDLVFSDVVMPGGMSGYDLMAEIRKRHPDINVVLTSGHVSVARGADVRPIPDVTLLRKPYSLAALAQAVARALRQDDPPS